ncbi:MAG TPA: metallophosphoesterase family protein [Candidatus Ozemobacteraceae bacterium]|nr:metallophosphoesterase family protein [Candidatus Ozemobacteraceae bacterium]HQG27965.1 metallophosphoesterase family protein [Candidatus Ozemobacteraceae bacterium]
MLLGIISDTHLEPSNGAGLPDWIVEAFAGVDLILHAGDIESDALLLELEAIAPVQAVRGNCDVDLPALPVTRAIPVPGYGIILMAHRPEDALRRLMTGVRGIIHGHTHKAEFRTHTSPWVLNPGSPTKPRGGGKPSVALLTVIGEEVQAAFRFRPGSADE